MNFIKIKIALERSRVTKTKLSYEFNETNAAN